MDEYIDQDGNNVPLCVVCGYWRATSGDVCEMCLNDRIRETMEDE